MQKFIGRERFEFSNGAVGWSPGGSFDCLGPYARVQYCPIADTTLRLTCYATGYADTFFSVPACTRYHGKYVKGYFTVDDGAITFRVLDSYQHLFDQLVKTAEEENSDGKEARTQQDAAEE